tara:strand:+ start:649 stop:2619 length:1971 start_codon:yes stop_codon:yes gene_type:complete
MSYFKINSTFKPTISQNRAVNDLSIGLKEKKWQTLLGVTGSGKTFTMANLIENLNKPTLIMSHNKTLAAQLYGEFKQLFPDNAVEYFISYYDYYQPEAYLPVTDTFIEKDASVNEEIDKLRLKATESLLTRNDVIVVSSVSSIYGIGSPKEYQNKVVKIFKNEKINIRNLCRQLVEIYYTRNDAVFERGNFRVRGDLIEIYPAYENYGLRIELFGNNVESIYYFDPISGNVLDNVESIFIYPAKHFVADDQMINNVIDSIKDELNDRLEWLRSNNKLLEAQRLEQRTNFDIEMMLEVGYCSGIENYSMYFSERKKGERPYTLFDYFPKDYLLFMDESHVTLPQIQGMYFGDRSRKETLVEHGFRLPSALENRPLKFKEFENVVNKCIFVSATPSDREHNYTNGEIVELILRPTGLIDPEIFVRPSINQIDDLLIEINKCLEKKERVLITTLTKRMSEDLTDYFSSFNLKVKYLHSEIDSLERVKLLRELRLGIFDVLIGINLLREGLDLPEVSLVAVLDADKEGFLRSERSLMQTAGRASRNINGKVIFYADKITKSIEKVINETNRRRIIQKDYNKKNNIIPRSIVKSNEEIFISTSVADKNIKNKKESDENFYENFDKDLGIEMLKKEMLNAAKDLNFEKASKIKDYIDSMEKS